MSFERFVILAVCAVVVSIPVVLFIPRARASVLFDRLLWLATPIVAFLVGWFAALFAADARVTFLNWLVIADTSIIAALVGAIVGALTVNVPLWLLDRYEPTDET